MYQALKQIELPAAESVIDFTNKLEVEIAQNGKSSCKDTKAEKVCKRLNIIAKSLHIICLFT